MLNDASISTTVPLIDIQSAEFARQYELGKWWSMYGDEQGSEPVPARDIRCARKDQQARDVVTVGPKA